MTAHFPQLQINQRPQIPGQQAHSAVKQNTISPSLRIPKVMVIAVSGNKASYIQEMYFFRYRYY